MFTGLVQTTAKIISSETIETGTRLIVERGGLQGEVREGDSVCVGGVCLTAVNIQPKRISFDVIHETLMTTSLGMVSAGEQVNLELAVTPSQPMGGHFMQGHVDGIASIENIHTNDGEYLLTIKPFDDDVMDYIIPRGSIAIEGVSLTIARVAEHTFDVALIPTTLEATMLSDLVVGDVVNIEADILAKTVVHQMQRMNAATRKQAGKCVTMQSLADAGYLPGS